MQALPTYQQAIAALNSSTPQQPASYAAHSEMLMGAVNNAVVYNYKLMGEEETPNVYIRYLKGENGITGGWCTPATLEWLIDRDNIPFTYAS